MFLLVIGKVYLPTFNYYFRVLFITFQEEKKKQIFN